MSLTSRQAKIVALAACLACMLPAGVFSIDTHSISIDTRSNLTPTPAPVPAADTAPPDDGGDPDPDEDPGDLFSREGTDDDYLAERRESDAMKEMHQQAIREKAAEFHALLGRARWPKRGFHHRPPAGRQHSHIPGADSWGSMHVCLIAVIMATVGGGVLYETKRRRDARGVESVVDPDESEGEPLLGFGQRGNHPRHMFVAHLRALAKAICWRHTHRRSLPLHAVRVVVPVSLIWVMNKLYDGLTAGFAADKDFAKTIKMAGVKPEEVSGGVLDWAFTVVMLWVVTISMYFFVKHLSLESENGMRHILHVSGLSRWAYILGTAGVEGFALTMCSLVIVFFFSHCILQIRIAVWSSLLLQLILVTVMLICSLATGYLFLYMSPSARITNMFLQLPCMLMMIAGPASAMYTPVPERGGQCWMTLLFPVVSSYRSFFALVAGCFKGRCLTFSDVIVALPDRRATLWEIMHGADGLDSPNDQLTPPTVVLSFLLLALIQLVLSSGLIVFLDMRSHPSLTTPHKETASSAVVEVREVAHRYGWLRKMSTASAQVLKGVSFTISPGEVLGLLGPNGAGKTTTIRCIVGEEVPTVGSVAVNSSCGATTSIGFCPQETIVSEDLTVAENLLFFAHVRGADNIEAAHLLENMLSISRLTEKRNSMPDALSGGMRRRLCVTCALIGSPSLAILDEPTTGLDPMSRRGIWTTIQDMKLGGGCCLLTTHMLEEAEVLCSNLVVLKQGEIAARGSVQELKEKWGAGYFLHVDCKPNEQAVAQEFLSDCLPAESRIPIKANMGQLTYRLTVEDEDLGALLTVVASGKKNGGISRWGVVQSSLEDTYLQIIDGDDEKEGSKLNSKLIERASPV